MEAQRLALRQVEDEKAALTEDLRRQEEASRADLARLVAALEESEVQKGALNAEKERLQEVERERDVLREEAAKAEQQKEDLGKQLEETLRLTEEKEHQLASEVEKCRARMEELTQTQERLQEALKEKGDLQKMVGLRLLSLFARHIRRPSQSACSEPRRLCDGPATPRLH